MSAPKRQKLNKRQRVSNGPMDRYLVQQPQQPPLAPVAIETVSVEDRQIPAPENPSDVRQNPNESTSSTRSTSSASVNEGSTTSDYFSTESRDATANEDDDVFIVDAEELPPQVPTAGPSSAAGEREVLSQIDLNPQISDNQLLPVPSHTREELLGCWQWKLTGEPVFTSRVEGQEWVRYVDPQFLSCTRPWKDVGNNKTVPLADKPWISEFVNRMASNEKTFTIFTGQSTPAILGGSSRLRAFLSLILNFDIKLIRIEDISAFGDCRLRVTKLEESLLKPYPKDHVLDPLQTWIKGSNGKSKQITRPQQITLINENAVMAYFGPGTIWCRYKQCEMRQLVTASPVISLGNGEEIHLTRRFSCCTPSPIYHLQCQTCLTPPENSPMSYIGQSGKNLARRVNLHKNSNGRSKPTQDQIQEIKGGKDPHSYRQTTWFHFNAEHSGVPYDHIKATILWQEENKIDRLRIESRFHHVLRHLPYSDGRGNYNSACNHPTRDEETANDIINQLTYGRTNPAAEPGLKSLIREPNLTDEIRNAWQWDLETCEAVPISVEEDKKWMRYVDPQFDSLMRPYSRESGSDYSPTCNTFRLNMWTNKETFTIKVRDINELGTLLRRIASFQVKKINLSFLTKLSFSTGGSTTILVQKLDIPLLPYSEDYPDTGYPTTPDNCFDTYRKFVDEINIDSRYGHLGPGTYWCRRSSCHLKDVVTGQPIVNWGHESPITLDRHYLCSTPEVSYFLHCNTCIQNSTPSNYVGETGRPLQTRLCDHFHCQLEVYGRKPFPTTIEAANKVLHGEDEHRVRQWPKFHFNFEHAPQLDPYSHCRATILAREKDSHRRKEIELEFLSKFQNVKFENGCGNLNQSSDARN